MPADMRAVFITLSDAFRSMRQEGGGSLLDTLIETLEADAESPPKEVKGVSDSFLDGEYIFAGCALLSTHPRRSNACGCCAGR